MEKWGVGLTKEKFFDEVQTYVQQNKLKVRFKNGRPGENYWRGFKKRNGIYFKKAERLENLLLVQQSNPFVIYGFYNFLKKTLIDLDLLDMPDAIYNLDETSFCNDPGNTKVVGGEGVKSSRGTRGNGHQNTTVPACIRADGQKKPPLIVFSAKNT